MKINVILLLAFLTISATSKAKDIPATEIAENSIAIPKITAIPASCNGEKTGSIQIAYGNKNEWQARIRFGNQQLVKNISNDTKISFDSLGEGTYMVEVWKENLKIHQEPVTIEHLEKVTAPYVLTQENSGSSVVLHVTNYTAGATSYYWDFGDHTTSTDYAPTHEYSKPGYFMVSLTVSDGNGCMVTKRKSLLIGAEQN